MSQSITQLTPQLWVAQSRLFATNSGIFLAAGQACLIDPGVFRDEIDGIADFVNQQQAVVEALILTHSHWDHIFGPEGFPDAKIIAQVNYLKETSTEAGAATLRQIEEFFVEHAVRRTASFVLPQPDVTFEQEMLLVIGDQTLRLLHMPGHRRDQMVIEHAESGTLWSADMLSDTDVPFVCESLLTYQRTLEKLSAMEFQLLVPGHGQPAVGSAAVRQRIDADRAYLQALHEMVAQSVNLGKTVEETVRACAHIPRRPGEENDDTHKNNVESAYLELGGAGEKGSLGWGMIFP